MHDIQELKSSILKAVDHFNFKRNTLTKAEDIAEAIVTKTLEYINEGDINAVDFVFPYQEIYKMVWGNVVGSDKASRAVRVHMENLTLVFDIKSELNVFLIAEGCHPVKLEVHSSTGHRRTLIGITTTSDEGVENNLPNGIIKYYATQLPKPYFWTKPFIKLALSPYKVGMFAALLFAIGLLVIASLLKIIVSFNPIVNAVLIMAALASFFTYLKLRELLERGLTPIPYAMIPIKQSNAFFVLSRAAKGQSEIGLDSISVVYEGKCGICGDKLLIEKSKEFMGRYIGKCAVAPSEHVFSFDHVTKTGKTLR